MPVTMPVIWIVAFVLLAILEFATPQFVSIWFAAGALVAFVVSLFDVPLFAQVGVFLAASVLFLAITRPLYRKYVSVKLTPTNADRLIGRSAIVIEAIDNDMAVGLVQIDGQIWSARSFDEAKIEIGQKVIVQAIHGVKLVVQANQVASTQQEEL